MQSKIKKNLIHRHTTKHLFGLGQVIDLSGCKFVMYKHGLESIKVLVTTPECKNVTLSSRNAQRTSC